jgi:Holin of 3TMs, for gene-transfer release
MNPLGIGAIIDSVGKVASDLITTDKERIELELEGRRIDQATDLAQMEVNKTEAQNQNLFVAGWRPAIGWVGAAAMAYQFLAYPLLVWSWTWMQAEQIVPQEVKPPPMLDTEALWVILSGMLGIAGMRSFEKTRGVTR